MYSKVKDDFMCGGEISQALGILKKTGRSLIPVSILSLASIGKAYSAPIALQVVPVLTQIKDILAQLGPSLSAVLFILAGIFYAIGQMLPPDKKAQFHTTAVNIIIGAIVVGALSVASTSLAIASTHLITNLTNGLTNNTIG